MKCFKSLFSIINHNINVLTNQRVNNNIESIESMNSFESYMSDSCFGEDEIILQKSKRFRKSDRKESSKIRSGRWNTQQQKLYLEFIDTNKSLLQKPRFRRYSKIFKLMAQFIQSRGADQCRSHHQKKQKMHKTLDKIILHCKQTLFSAQIQSQSQKPRDETLSNKGDQTVKFQNQQRSFQMEKGVLCEQFLLRESTEYCLGESEELSQYSIRQRKLSDLFEEEYEDPYKILY